MSVDLLIWRLFGICFLETGTVDYHRIDRPFLDLRAAWKLTEEENRNDNCARFVLIAAKESGMGSVILAVACHRPPFRCFTPLDQRLRTMPACADNNIPHGSLVVGKQTAAVQTIIFYPLGEISSESGGI